MTLLSINTQTFQVRSYACTNGKRIKTTEVTFNQVLGSEDVEAMRGNPEKFVSDLRGVPDTMPSEFEPDVA